MALITGAGGGVGEAVAIRFAREGWATVLTSRTPAKLEATADNVRAEVADAAVTTVAADLTDPDEAQNIVDQAIETFGRLDAMANVAGYASEVELGKSDAAEWRRTIDVNVSAIVYLVDAAWEQLAAGEGATVVNVSSMASIDPFPSFAYYAPAKAAVNMFGRMVAGQGEEVGIRAVTVAPGAIETPMLRSLFGKDQLPPEKTLDPSQVAAAVVELAIAERDFESGEVIELPSPE
ncbi:MAG: SDR family oxidoreductase [Phycisphaeraceae bacterium]|nr:SDR family oxidoreductase [Phycisphaeraceae bacterium]